MEQRDQVYDEVEATRAIDSLMVRVCLRLGQWQFELQERRFGGDERRILGAFAQALAFNVNNEYKPWQSWAQINFDLVEAQDADRMLLGSRKEEARPVLQHVVAAIQAYFRALGFPQGILISLFYPWC